MPWLDTDTIKKIYILKKSWIKNVKSPEAAEHDKISISTLNKCDELILYCSNRMLCKVLDTSSSSSR